MPYSRSGVRIAFGTDEDGPLAEAIRSHLRDAGHQVTDVAPGAEWPEVGRAVGQSVASGEVERGVVCCWTGTGVSMAANKVAGVRAALCTDAATAEGSRRWNDANVLAMGIRLTSPEMAAEMLDAFLATDVGPGEAGAVARVEPR